jgi:hypothetical protein
VHKLLLQLTGELDSRVGTTAQALSSERPTQPKKMSACAPGTTLDRDDSSAPPNLLESQHQPACSATMTAAASDRSSTPPRFISLHTRSGRKALARIKRKLHGQRRSSFPIAGNFCYPIDHNPMALAAIASDSVTKIKDALNPSNLMQICFQLSGIPEHQRQSPTVSMILSGKSIGSNLQKRPLALPLGSRS